MHYEDKKAEVMVEELLKALLAWVEVPDLTMDSGWEVIIPSAATKRKRDEVAQGWRKQQREDEICPVK